MGTRRKVRGKIISYPLHSMCNLLYVEHNVFVLCVVQCGSKSSRFVMLNFVSVFLSFMLTEVYWATMNVKQDEDLQIIQIKFTEVCKFQQLHKKFKK